DDEQGPVEAGATEATDSPAAEGETWGANSSQPSRSAMEDALDARTDAGFPRGGGAEPAARGGGAGRLFGMGGGRRRRPRRWRIQSRGVRPGRNHARPLAARASA